MTTIQVPIATTTPVAPTAPIDYKQRDLDLYYKWKETGDKRAMSNLIKSLHPIIYSEVRRAGTALPEAALSAEAKYWAIRALETYDPSKGVAISTHVTNYLPKVRRLNYKYQNMARLPENLQLQYTNFNNAVSHLQEALNRDPTEKEIAQELGWTEGQVFKFRGSLYQDLVESQNQRETEATQFNTNKFLLEHILSQLDDQEKFLLMHKGEMPASELAAKMNVNVSRLNYLSAKLRDKIANIKKEVGMY